MWKWLLLLILLGVPGLGFYNYHRNAHLDQELQNRTYANLSDADLNALAEAYRGEVDRLRRMLTEDPDGQAALDGIAAGDFGRKVKRFESFQQENREWKAARGQAMEREAALEELERELSIRERRLDEPLQRVKRRLLHF